MTDSAEISSPTILIVEDHDQLRASLRDWLGAVFTHSHLMEAPSGEAALLLVAGQPPDLIVMDVGLPKMSGIEAARQIKRLIPQARVVMLSIHEEQRYQEDAASAGANAYVLKRKMHTDLIPVLTTLLSESQRNDV